MNILKNDMYLNPKHSNFKNVPSDSRNTVHWWNGFELFGLQGFLFYSALEPWWSGDIDFTRAKTVTFSRSRYFSSYV